MTTTKPHDSEQTPSRETISADEDLWIRQYITQFELHVLEASRSLPKDAPIQESQLATAQSILQTYIDSGMELESVMELIGQVAVGWKYGHMAWTDALNQRRFELIDKEIQGSLTAAEGIELAGLTKSMREHVDSESNLPMKGARALHEKLLELKSTGVSS